MSEGNTEKYVNIENYLSRAENSSWADETEEDHERETKPKQAWATVASSVVDEAPTFAAIQAEEEKAAAAASKAAAEAAKKAPYRTPQKSHQSSYDNPERHYEPRSYGDRSDRSDRAPREKQPVPTEPPFTAFIGNLAYDVEESDIMEYFGELGVVTIRLLKDPSGKPKGYGYIEFETADGLTNSLMANDQKLKGRAMNLDVAKPQQASSSSWGSSGNRDRGSERNNRPSYNNRDRDQSWGPGSGSRDNRERDPSWGPAPGSDRFNKDRPASFNRPPPSGERPKLNINTPAVKPPQSPREPPKVGGGSTGPQSKPSPESIFGTQITTDQIQKMDQAAEQRLKRELERDALRDAQRKQYDRNDRDKAPLSARSPRTTGRGETQTEDSRLQSSWRKDGKPSSSSSTVKPPYNMNFARRDDNTKPEGRGPQKSLVDSEGFREQTSRPGHNRGWENNQSTTRPRDQETKNPNPKENQNKFASLDVEDEE